MVLVASAQAHTLTFPSAHDGRCQSSTPLPVRL